MMESNERIGGFYSVGIDPQIFSEDQIRQETLERFYVIFGA